MSTSRDAQLLKSIAEEKNDSKRLGLIEDYFIGQKAYIDKKIGNEKSLPISQAYTKLDTFYTTHYMDSAQLENARTLFTRANEILFKGTPKERYITDTLNTLETAIQQRRKRDTTYTEQSESKPSILGKLFSMFSTTAATKKEKGPQAVDKEKDREDNLKL